MRGASLQQPVAPLVRVRRFLWAHPEWWSIVLAGAAWLLMLLPMGGNTGGHGAHAHHTAAGMPTLSFTGELWYWGLMVVAMMVPLMIEPLRWIAFQSFHHRRHRAILLFLVGFLAPWLLLGVPVAWLRTMSWGHHPLIAPALFGLAALWAMVRLRQRALVFCHWTMPLAPSGWKAERDCLQYGSTIGASCVVTCALLMVACSFTGHNLVAMVGGTVLGAIERTSFRPPTVRIAVGAVLLAGWFLLVR